MTGKRSKNCSPTAGSPLSGNISDNSSYYCKDQDRFLPIANVSRIMKKSLPTNAKISKEAKETVQECVSEFISFITGEASDKCQREKRKTVNGDDLLWAMTTLGFENYVSPLKVYLSKYRENEGEKTSMAREEEDRHGEVSRVVSVSDSTSKKKVDFLTSSRNGLLPYYNHPLGEAKNIHINPKYYEEDPAGSMHRVLGYGNNEVEGSTNVGVIATNNLKYGVEW